jgi:hypothetical protein
MTCRLSILIVKYYDRIYMLLSIIESLKYSPLIETKTKNNNKV